VSWEKGFCDGLSQSKVFMPILSRGAINHPDKPSQNFSKLTNDSPCDNVLLEHLLALELRSRGLTERIHCILIGDIMTEGENEGDKNEDLVLGVRQYTNYFDSHCHPVIPEEDNLIVTSVLEKCSEHLSRLALGLPLLTKMTVSRILAAIVSNRGTIVEGREDKAYDSIVNDIKDILTI
jgi:hypothetical protein